MGLESAAALKSLAGQYEYGGPPDIDQIMADFTRLPIGDDRAGWLQLAGMVSSDKIAGPLYLSSVAWADGYWPAIKQWGYLCAVEFVGARKSEQRRRSLVESYRLDWGHQAARDGLAIAMWGVGEVPGSRDRALSFACGQRAYRRVRDDVSRQAGDLIGEYRRWLNECMTGRFSPELMSRWEAATGASWTG